MIHAQALLKKEINNIVNRMNEIQNQIGPLLEEKEELDSIANELEEAIKKLGNNEEQNFT